MFAHLIRIGKWKLVNFKILTCITSEYQFFKLANTSLCQDGLVVHVGHWFASRPGHTKDYHN